MDTHLAAGLGLAWATPTGHRGGGDTSVAERYTSSAGDLWVKCEGRAEALLMLQGEAESLRAIAATGTVRCPRVLGVVDITDASAGTHPGAALATEYLEIGRCTDMPRLGRELAAMHLHNARRCGRPGYVAQYGFDRPTWCGALPQGNVWRETWGEFYIGKLEEQVARLDGEIIELWPHLREAALEILGAVEAPPSLLHGDLWSGNVGGVGGDPLIFDPACYYGHHEADLAIGAMFGGFDAAFHDAYTAVLPRDDRCGTREDLYELFHYLNHWAIFGGGYRGQSLRIVKGLLK